MEEIYIDMHGFEPDEELRQHIVQKFYSVFGLKQYMLRKFSIKLFHENYEQGDACVRCSVQADVKNQPVVITELTSPSAITAIDLAIEHANLKLSHRINGNKEIQKRVQQKRDDPLHH